MTWNPPPLASSTHIYAVTHSTRQLQKSLSRHQILITSEAFSKTETSFFFFNSLTQYLWPHYYLATRTNDTLRCMNGVRHCEIDLSKNKNTAHPIKAQYWREGTRRWTQTLMRNEYSCFCPQRPEVFPYITSTRRKLAMQNLKRSNQPTWCGRKYNVSEDIKLTQRRQSCKQCTFTRWRLSRQSLCFRRIQTTSLVELPERALQECQTPKVWFDEGNAIKLLDCAQYKRVSSLNCLWAYIDGWMDGSLRCRRQERTRLWKTWRAEISDYRHCKIQKT
jgi:hypothetical protein